MRQAGVLAAAGLVALRDMRGRLGEDHEHARALVRGLAEISGWILQTPDPLTNIVYARLPGARFTNRRFVDALRQCGVLCNAVGNDRIRMVTHHDVGEADIRTALAAVARTWESLAITA